MLENDKKIVICVRASRCECSACFHKQKHEEVAA